MTPQDQDLASAIVKQVQNGGIRQASVLRPRVGGGFDWFLLVEKLGLPVAGLVAMWFLLVNTFIVPMRESNDRLINTNISSQEALIKNQAALNEAVQINVQELKNLREFQARVGEVHAEQLKEAKALTATMHRAEETMSGLPDERRKFYDEQKKLLTEIRDRLPGEG